VLETASGPRGNGKMTDGGLQKVAFFLLIALMIYVGGSGGA
jgi:hypothetical protein